MKRRILALLAVPALAVGFAFTPAGMGEARAMPIPDLSGYACWQARQYVADAYSYGDYETAQYIEGWVAQCCSST